MLVEEKALKRVNLRICSEIWIFMVLLLLLLVGATLPLSNWVRMDRHLMLDLNGSQGLWVDQFWYAFSKFNTWLLVFPVIVFTLWRTCQGSLREKLLFVLAVFLLFVFLDQISSSVIKPLIARPRPSHDPAICSLLHYVNGYHGGRFGFVSGHATNIAGLCTWLCLTFRDRFSRMVFILFAAALCYSRIYLGVHYPGDILAGSLLGCSVTYFYYTRMTRHFAIEATGRPTLLISAITITIAAIWVYSGIKVLR